MLTKILLIILTTMMVTSFVLIIRWWLKYGRELFKTFSELKKTMSQTGMMNQLKDPLDLKKLMSDLNQINDIMGKKRK